MFEVGLPLLAKSIHARLGLLLAYYESAVLQAILLGKISGSEFCLIVSLCWGHMNIQSAQ